MRIVILISAHTAHTVIDDIAILGEAVQLRLAKLDRLLRSRDKARGSRTVAAYLAVCGGVVQSCRCVFCH